MVPYISFLSLTFLLSEHSFPPELWTHLSEIFNKSSSEYLICFHNPKVIMERYGFDVELLAQTPTSMHGSSEVHTGFIYKRTKTTRPVGQVSCDPLFQEAWETVKGKNLRSIHKAINASTEEQLREGRLTRSRGIQMCIEPERAE